MNRISQWFQVNPDQASGDDRLFIRERILTVVLIGAAALGGVAYYINLQTSIQSKSWGWIAIYTLALAWVCAIAFIRRIPYSFRAVSLLVILYGLGIVSALQFGAAGDARIWLLGSVIFASIFLGLRTGVFFVFGATITYLAIGWMMHQGITEIPDPGTLLDFDNFDSWSTTAVPFFAIGIIIVASIGVLVNSLTTSIKRSRELASALSFDREKLETRSKALERRELQIRTAAEISRTAIAELDPEILFQRVVDLIQERFNLYYVGVFVVETSGHFAILRAGTGEAGRRMLEQGHRLSVGGTSMIGYAISNKQARIASDVGLDAHHFNNPELPETRSELAIPMISGNHVLGALTVQSKISSAFDQDDVTVFQGIADSLAIALENARLFQQVQTSLQEVQTLHNQYILESWSNLTSQHQGLSYTFSQDPSLSEQIARANLPGTKIDFPLMLRDQAIGNLSIEADRSALTLPEKAFIDAVAQQTALALENIRLVEETQRAARQEHVVSKISQELSQVMSVESVIKTTMRELGRLPHVTEVTIHIDPTSQKK